MTREVLACPICGRTLAYKRRGGSVVPEPGVMVCRLTVAGGTSLACSWMHCGGIRYLDGKAVVITPLRSAKLVAN